MHTSLKILFIHQNFPGQFRFLAPALVLRGHQVVAMTMRRDLGPNWNGVRVMAYAAGRRSGADIHPWLADMEAKVIRGQACLQAARELHSSGFTPDLIVAHHGWGESLFIKDLWPQCKMVIYCEFFYKARGADVGFDPEFQSAVHDDVSRLKLKNICNLLHFDVAEAGICPTSWQASTFPEPFRQKISIIHDGIDTNLVRPNQDRTLTLGSETVLTKNSRVVTFICRNLEPYRGHHIFMRALPKLFAACPDIRVLIVGGDKVSYGATSPSGSSWRSILAQEARSKMTDEQWQRVHFLGNVPYEQFLSLLQISTVHVYLTYPFVLSWSLLEAMSAECAVVASDTEPVREAIRHKETGLLVDFFAPEALAESVSELLNDPSQRARLGKAARQHIVEQYDLQTRCLPQQLAWVDSMFRH